MECHACGAELDPRDKFCSKCGAITERGKGASELAGRYVAELADGFGKLFAVALGYVTNPENRKRVAVGGGVALVLFISFTSNPISRGVGSIFEPSPDAPTFNDDGSPNFAEYEDFFLADEEEYRVTGTANIRDFPTSNSTTVVGTFEGGETVFAREVKGFDASSQWFKLTSGGYVWGGNLVSANASVGAASGPQFPARLIGQWSDFADCTGEGNGVDFWISANQLSFGSVTYNLVGPTTIERGYPAFNLVDANSANPGRPMTLFEDASLPIIWIWYGEDPGGEQYHYFPVPDSCDGAIAINEQIRRRSR